MLPLLETASVEDKKVLVRVDFNVPFVTGTITDQTRIKRCLPTINYLVNQGAKVIILTHLGRPNGQVDPQLSTAQLIPALGSLINCPIKFIDDCVGPKVKAAIDELQDGEILLLENLRFHSAEETDDAVFAQQLASLADIYINDGFAVSHRAHASVHAITEYLPSYAGLLFQEEVYALQAALDQPQRPLVAIVGGAKVSTKLQILENLVDNVDILILGGGIANTFLKAQHHDIGGSLYEPNMVATATRILHKAVARGCEIVVPEDVVVCDELQGADPETVAIKDIKPHHKIFDIGPRTIDYIQLQIFKAKTLVWNGPFGVFEVPPYDAGTHAIVETVATHTKANQLFSLAGGGETLSAINMAGGSQGFSYLSTAGGAFLEWLEGRTLPGVQALQQAD